MLQKVKRSNKLLVEPPTVAIGDIVFNLIVFFLVLVSVQPDRGFKQSIPRSETQQEQKQDEPQNVEVQLTRTAVLINGADVPLADFVGQLRTKLAGKSRPEDRVVIVKSQKDTPYKHWVDVTTRIDQAGGIVTLQMEEERTVSIE